MIEEIKKYDNNFDEAIFLSKVDHIFIMLLDSITDRNIDTVKHYLSDDIYTKYNNMVNSYKTDKKIRLFDEMNVKSTSITNYNIEGDLINIEVLLTSRYMDYFVNENGEYISGTNDHRIETDHHIILTKKINSLNLGTARRCNHCGKTLDINHSGVCPYCNQVIDITNYEYIVTKLN